jgi:transcription elongation factor GreA
LRIDRKSGVRLSHFDRVGEPEADASKGKISVTSPIARALIGKTMGAIVEVEAPGGAKVYKIQQMEWLEDSPKRRE